MSRLRASLTERLCRCLAFHMVETELALKFMDDSPPEIQEEIDRARGLIIEAGYDIDNLYPIADRPMAEAASMN